LVDNQASACGLTFIKVKQGMFDTQVPMKMHAAALLAWSLGALAAPNDGALKDITTVRVGNYGAPSTNLHGKELAPVLTELNEMRSKQWRQADTRLTCYSTLTLMNGPKTVAIFRVGPDALVERPVGKNDLAYSLAITESDLPVIRKHLEEAAPAICR
jgi:hypothetical protein